MGAAREAKASAAATELARIFTFMVLVVDTKKTVGLAQLTEYECLVKIL